MVSSSVFVEGYRRRLRAILDAEREARGRPMRFDSLNADLRRWLKASIEAGHDGEALRQALCAAGYDGGFARAAVETALARLRPSAAGPAPSMPQLEPFDATANALATGDRRVEILMSLASPRIVLFGNLLSAEECEEMIEASRRRLQRSTVVNAATGAYDVHADRSSRGTHFERGENALVARIERRISELTGCPVENGEPLQVLHYEVGAEYKPHHDYFDAAQAGNDRVLAMGGQRIATVVMYLNDVEAGGATAFPSLGLEVLPRRGSAVYFAYTGVSGETDARTLHGGSPVAAGEKWIATKWLRQRRYGAPPIA
jgi:prolyl 4-hydroxylase